jgi:hypothetical protein
MLFVQIIIVLGIRANGSIFKTLKKIQKHIFSIIILEIPLYFSTGKKNFYGHLFV